MYSGRIERLELDEIFSGAVPGSLGSLIYNLRHLTEASDPFLWQSIKIIYRAFAEDVDDDLRKSVFLYLVQEVEASELSAEVILTLVQFETNHLLVNKAVGAYLQHKRVPFEDPFAAARRILALLEERTVANPGAAFAGLVCFGDRRICAVLRSARDSITLEEARAFSRAAAGPLQRATIEFCVEWLIDLMRFNEYEIAIQVAYALSSMVINDSTLLVHDIHYNFGPYGFSHSKAFPEITFNELLEELAPLIDILAEGRLPALQRMIEILQDPTRQSLERLDQRKISTRRTRQDRRVSDRRIVNIKPRIDLRSGQRRGDQRRIEIRR